METTITQNRAPKKQEEEKKPKKKKEEVTEDGISDKK